MAVLPINQKEQSAMTTESTNHIQVLAVTAAKGGVGKSNVALNLAVSLAKQSKRVLLLDGDLALANIDILMGVHPKRTIWDVLEGRCGLNEVILPTELGVYLLPAASGRMTLTQLNGLQYAGLVSAFEQLDNEFDYLIIDTGAGISETVLRFVCSAQEVLVVVCDEPTSIVDSYALIQALHTQYGIDRYHILSNRVDSPAEGRALFMKLQQLTETHLCLQLNYMGSLSQDDCLRRAVKEQTPVVCAYPHAKSAKEFNRLAQSVMSWPAKASVASNAPFFLNRLLQQDTQAG